MQVKSASIGNAMPETPSRLRQSIASLGLIAILALILVTGFALHAYWMLQNHDNSWYLIVADRLLAGGHYVSDFDEPNPPLIILLMVPPAFAAAWLHLAPYTAFSAYVGLLLAVSTLIVRPVVDWFYPGRYGLAAFVLIAYVAILTFDPGYEYGQREHLAIILFFPGLFWFAAREAGRSEPPTGTALLALVLASLAVLIKPYFLLAPLALLAVRAARLRTWRVLTDPAVLILVATALLYSAIIILVFPGYFQEMAIQRQVYFAWNRGWMTVMEASRDAIAAVCLAVAVTILLPMARERRVLAGYLCLAAVAWLIAAWVQKRGFAYQLLPTVELAYMALIVLLVELLGFRRSPSHLGVSSVALAGAILTGAAFVSLRPVMEMFTFERSIFRGKPLVRDLHDLAAGQPILLLTGGFQYGVPYLADVQLGSRAPSQILLPGIIRLAEGNADQRALAARLAMLASQELVEDIDRYKPHIVAVDLRAERQGLSDSFSILDFYLEHPDFRLAWQHYSLVRTDDGWEFFARLPDR
jgi:hypothetical protein